MADLHADAVFEMLPAALRTASAPPPSSGGFFAFLSAPARPSEAVEAEFAEASEELKKRMLELGIGAGDKVPLELLRQAAYGLDPDLARRAREGMKQSGDLLAVELIADTLRGPLAAGERPR